MRLLHRCAHSQTGAARPQRTFDRHGIHYRPHQPARRRRIAVVGSATDQDRDSPGLRRIATTGHCQRRPQPHHRRRVGPACHPRAAIEHSDGRHHREFRRARHRFAAAGAGGDARRQPRHQPCRLRPRARVPLVLRRDDPAGRRDLRDRPLLAGQERGARHARARPHAAGAPDAGAGNRATRAVASDDCSVPGNGRRAGVCPAARSGASDAGVVQPCCRAACRNPCPGGRRQPAVGGCSRRGSEPGRGRAAVAGVTTGRRRGATVDDHEPCGSRRRCVGADAACRTGCAAARRGGA